MPLQSLTLRDFRNHSNTRVVFDPGVTTIVGPNDSGKTALLTALGLVCLNRPNGYRFVRWGRKKTKLILEVDDHEIVRIRGRVENKFLLDGKEYKAFGLGVVPPDVEKVLKVSQVNFQNQIDPPFWFLETGGNASKKLNAIVNLSEIDRVLDIAASEVRVAKAKAKESEDRIVECKETVESKKWVVEFSRDLAHVEALERTASENALAASNLNDLLSIASLSRAKKRRAEDVVSDTETVLAAEANARGAASRVSLLGVLVRKLDKVQSVLTSESPDLSGVDALLESGNAVFARRSNLESLILEYKSEKETKCLRQKELELAEKELTTKSKGRCPLCGNKPESHEHSPSSAPTYTCPRSRRQSGKRPRSGDGST